MAKEKVHYPDGNEAAARVSYMFSEVAAIYPITRLLQWRSIVDAWSAKGRKNLFGQIVTVQEMQSEGGAQVPLCTAHSSWCTHNNIHCFTRFVVDDSNMYKIAGEMLPCVFDVSARANRYTLILYLRRPFRRYGLSADRFRNVLLWFSAEVMDLTAVPHLASLKTSIPFVNFFDGFRNITEYQKIEMIDQDEVAKLPRSRRCETFPRRAHSPERPVNPWYRWNPETFFTHREACNQYYENIPEVVEDYLAKIKDITGREYPPLLLLWC